MLFVTQVSIFTTVFQGKKMYVITRSTVARSRCCHLLFSERIKFAWDVQQNRSEACGPVVQAMPSPIRQTKLGEEFSRYVDHQFRAVFERETTKGS